MESFLLHCYGVCDLRQLLSSVMYILPNFVFIFFQVEVGWIGKHLHRAMYVTGVRCLVCISSLYLLYNLEERREKKSFLLVVGYNSRSCETVKIY